MKGEHRRKKKNVIRLFFFYRLDNYHSPLIKKKMMPLFFIGFNMSKTKALTRDLFSSSFSSDDINSFHCMYVDCLDFSKGQ